MYTYEFHLLSYFRTFGRAIRRAPGEDLPGERLPGAEPRRLPEG